MSRQNLETALAREIFFGSHFAYIFITKCIIINSSSDDIVTKLWWKCNFLLYYFFLLVTFPSHLYHNVLKMCLVQICDENVILQKWHWKSGQLQIDPIVIKLWWKYNSRKKIMPILKLKNLTCLLEITVIHLCKKNSEDNFSLFSCMARYL